MRHALASKNILFHRPHLPWGFALESGIIVMENGKISQLIPTDPNEHASIVRQYPLTVSDVGDRLVTPAFVNPHTHIAMSFLRGLGGHPITYTQPNMISSLFFSVECSLTDEDVRAFSRIGAYENILNGVGLVWDHYYHGHACAQALKDVGLCGVVGPTLQDASHTPGYALRDKILQETQDIAHSKDYLNAGICAAYAPHASDTVSLELWKQVCKLSNQLNIPIHAHIAQSTEEWQYTTDTQKASGVIQWLHDSGILEEGYRFLWVHGVHISAQELPLLIDPKHALVFCPFSQAIFQHCADARSWEQAGCQWFVASDTVASNDSMSVQKELRFIAGLPKISPQKAGTKINTNTMHQQEAAHFADPKFLLKKVWDGPGLFHPQLKVGRIETEFLANLIVWETDHPAFWPMPSVFHVLRALTHGDVVPGAIHNTCIAGKWMGEFGNFVPSILNSVSYKLALKEANDRLKNQTHLIQKYW